MAPQQAGAGICPQLPTPSSSWAVPGQYDWLLPPATATGFSLSISARPISARLVQQIRSGRYVEMRDLLGDNASVRRQFEELQGTMGAHLLPVLSRPKLREVSTLPTWISCFLSYLAVATTDNATRDKLAYAVLIVKEAMRHGGQGWLEYDKLFRQQAAIDPTLPWNCIHAGLQATTILGQRATGQGTFCSVCQECDHTVAQCALAQLQQPTTRSATGSLARNATRICTSWNDGACTYPGSCSFRHVCSRCFRASHTVKSCRAQPKGRTGTATAPSRQQGSSSA